MSRHLVVHQGAASPDVEARGERKLAALATAMHQFSTASGGEATRSDSRRRRTRERALRALDEQSTEVSERTISIAS